ncbi:MAG: NAD(P)-binding domain-containing protein [Myxococcales bacterium]|nr:NAD(P)-binding domain-containing protein [Myxococcales bacterium]
MNDTSSMSPPIGILGGGGFGHALAIAAQKRGREVILWSRADASARGSSLRVTHEMADLRAAELIFIAVPSAHVAALGRALGAHLDGSHLLVHVSRGLVGDALEPLTMVLRMQTPSRRVGALAGPLSARALAEEIPAGAVVGTRFPEIVRAVEDALASSSMRVYHTPDVLGVEVASALVGVLALGTSYARALGVGPAALAIMATRGMAEAARLGAPLGASPQTFYGLAGFGDLVSAIAGDGRPEERLGRALAEGLDLQTACARVGAHIEGVGIARRVVAYAHRVGVECPVIQAIAAVVEGELDGPGAIAALMASRAGRE